VSGGASEASDRASPRSSGADGWAERFAHAVARRLPLDMGGGPEDAIFLAGAGRSGTTWLGEFLAGAVRLRYVFEPFHPVRSPPARLFPARSYLGPRDGSPEQASTAARILRGKLHDAWIDGHNRRVLARGRLVKDVWSNLRLGWLRARFPSTPIVLLVRHPCATIGSQARTGWDWHVEPATFLRQAALMERHLAGLEDVVAAAATDLERAVLGWCVDTFVPLRELRPGDAHVVFYERLVTEPVTELRSLFDYLRRDAPRSVDALSTPSALSLGGPAGTTPSTPADRVGSWTSSLSAEDVARAMELVERFGLGRLYGADPMPRAYAASAAFEPA
jgi:hypothetical protein